MDYTPDNFARDVYAAVEALGVERFYLAGHSLGATTVTHFVRDHPERVSGLVLMSGGALKARPTLTGGARETWLRNIEGYPGNISRAYWDEEHVGLDAGVRALLWEDWQRVPPQRMRGMQAEHVDLQPVLAVLEIPTLVVFRDADHTVPPGASAEGYLALNRDVRHLHVFHGVDHSPNSIVPAEVASVFGRFAEHVELRQAAG